MSTWIWLTLMAAVAQAFRTAGQKTLSERVSIWGTTFARYAFSLPLVWVYLYLQLHWQDSELPEISSTFLLYSLGAGLAQIAATVVIVKLFHLRNFAIGVIYSKSETVLVAVLGAIIFSQELSWAGWVSVLLGTVGLIFLNPPGQQGWRSLFSVSAAFGLGGGFLLALTTLWVRQASLSLDDDPLVASAYTLTVTILMQTVLLGGFIWFKEPQTLGKLIQQWKLSGSVGLLSLVGSIGWFTAFSLQNPALVKTLGQVEFFFTLIISSRLFREKHSPREYCGMALILSSVILLLWLA
ncbi:EamA family transporter [Endozoicomonas sp. 8E]|uniref:EamA family transporter n=1 Tax=Endozoicomonas sp. 8E TaxID=3035692 RepID=UPI0029394415|nr:EamA family transporter [Endozoicomonas sp. 8E]WOG26357.1 EamA family transporter [Endozoicomonas sp. 8E]